jgi:hypothetical protein
MFTLKWAPLRNSEKTFLAIYVSLLKLKKMVVDYFHSSFLLEKNSRKNILKEALTITSPIRDQSY